MNSFGSYGPGDPQTMPASAREYLEGDFDWQRAEVKREWQAAVDAYEDGLTDVEPPTWKEFWG